jgi:DNA-binding LacI/PurR family transcriptional regulator
MKEKPTLIQIANKAGVSIATVSRILNETGRVSPATRQKVLHAIRELEYNTALSKTAAAYGAILVLVPDFVNPFYANIIDGIQQTARDNHFEAFLVQTKDSYPTPNYYLNLLKKGHFSGVLWLSSTPPGELLTVIENHCPIVMCCEYPEDQSCSYVRIDDITAAYRAVNYLISLGCKKIGFVNCSQKYKYARHRRDGYLKALEQGGLRFNPEWYISIPSIDYTLAYSAILQTLNGDSHPDAFFTCSDVFAAATINAAQHLGIRVPEELSVIGFDNIETSRMTFPPITTIAQPGFQMGQQACSILMEKIENPKLPNRQILLSTELIIRDSTR